MSKPIIFHNIMLAINGNEEIYNQLVKDYIINMGYGHWSTYYDECEDCKKVTFKQINEFNERLRKDIDIVKDDPDLIDYKEKLENDDN